MPTSPVPDPGHPAIDLLPLAAELERAAHDAPDRPFLRMRMGEWSYGEVWRDAGPCLRPSDATLAAFRDQWLHTGDVLRQDAQGWLSLVGRRKDMVRRRGENISAAEVEQAIEQHPMVLACAVVGVPSEMTEEEVLACVVLRVGSRLAPQALHAWSRSQLARFMVPRYLRFLDAMPRTPTDKIEKFRLRQLGAAGAWDAGSSPQHLPSEGT